MLGARSSNFPLYFLFFTSVWSLVYRLSPEGTKPKVLGIAHAVLVTGTSLLCIFRGDDTALSCAASVAFFVVDTVGMAFADGLVSLGGGGRGKVTTASFSSVRLPRKMDYAHHVLGIIFGAVQHYWEDALCAPHVGCAFPYVQWNEISTPFYNAFRLTGGKSAVWGALFVLTFFASRVVGNTLWVIPLLYGNCSSIMGVFCAPYFALQYMWFCMIVKKMRSKSNGGEKRSKAE